VRTDGDTAQFTVTTSDEELDVLMYARVRRRVIEERLDATNPEHAGELSW
jgi:hypothetical protein